MNRIDELFIRKPKSILSVYFTAGYPQLTDTGLIISGLEEAGADLIEIGFPFSDPLADGPVIQASSHQALQNGMNLDILFSQLKDIKGTSQIPKIMMGYFNTVYQYKVERFIDHCAECGIDGVIIPDLPPEVYEKEYRELFESAGIHFICLVAPQTSAGRAKYLATLSRGFIYLLSSSSTTGSPVREGLSALPSLSALQTLSALPTHSALPNHSALPTISALPTLIGFGIHDHQSFEMACSRANGAIIGTGFIRHLNANLKKESGNSRSEQVNRLCKEFVKQIRG